MKTDPVRSALRMATWRPGHREYRRNSPRKIDAAVDAIIASDRAAAAAEVVKRHYAVAGF